MKHVYGLILLTALLAGCTAPPYVQQGINLTETSTYSRITTDLENSDTINYAILFNSLNGNEIGVSSGARPTEINVLPGEHYFVVRYWNYGTFADECLALTTEAGTNYVVRHQIVEYRVGFWIEDVGGKIVGNICIRNSSKDRK